MRESLFTRALKSNKIYYLALTVLFLIFAFRLLWGINDRPYEFWDEQTNVQVVSEMQQSGGIFPNMTLNGEPFFEKPPLWYLSTYYVCQIFGQSPVGMRLMSVMSGFGIWLLSFLVLNKFRSRTITLAWLTVLAGIGQLLEVSAGGVFSPHTLNSADSDAMQILFILISLGIYFLGVKQKKFKLLILSQIFLGLSILTKGPAGLILYFIQIFFIFKSRKDLNLKWWKIILFIEVIWIVVLPWYVYMSINYGSTFIYVNLGYHVVGRTTKVLEGHRANALYYLGLFFNPYLNLLWPLALVIIFHRIKNFKRDLLSKVAIIYSIAYLILISIMQTKLAWYILLLYGLIIFI